MNSRQVILIEDDEDDVEIFMLAYAETGYPNELKVFMDAQQAWAFLRTNEAKPLMVISDINMPKMSGFELRDKIVNDPLVNGKCFPYIFMSTSGDQDLIEESFKKSIQGYFRKESNFVAYTEILRNILFYWTTTMRPIIEK